MPDGAGGDLVTDSIPRTGSPESVLERLLDAHRVVMTTHINADGDGAGSQVALAELLRSRGVQAHVVNPTPFPELFKFLVPDPQSLILDAGSPGAAAACAEADLAVVLDTGELPRIGRVRQLIDHLPKVVVDHHQPGANAIPTEAALTDTRASAAGELVFELVEAAGGPWSQVIVDALYVALVTDTGGFRFSNASARCFRVASRLVELGARPDVLHARVFGNFRLRRYRLLQEALTTLDVSEDGRVAWMVVPADAYERLSAAPEDLEGFVDVPRGLEGVEIALLFRLTTLGKVKVSFRSSGDADVNALARGFGGGGHVKAAGALVSGELGQVVEAVVGAAVGAAAGQP